MIIINEVEHYVLLKLSPFISCFLSILVLKLEVRRNASTICALLLRLSKSIWEVSLHLNSTKKHKYKATFNVCVRWSLLFCINIHIYITIISLLLSPEFL